MSNFAFLQAEWPLMHESALRVEATANRETAKQAFSQFVVGTTATASQLEFIDLIVQYLTENGTMDAARLYESPFTDISQQGPEAVFPVSKVTELVRVLDDIRERARA